MEVVSFLCLKLFSCKFGLKCYFQNWTFAPMSNNLSCKKTLPAQKLLLYYEKRQIYSFPHFGSFRRILLYLWLNLYCVFQHKPKPVNRIRLTQPQNWTVQKPFESQVRVYFKRSTNKTTIAIHHLCCTNSTDSHHHVADHFYYQQ